MTPHLSERHSFLHQNGASGAEPPQLSGVRADDGSKLPRRWRRRGARHRRRLHALALVGVANDQQDASREVVAGGGHERLGVRDLIPQNIDDAPAAHLRFSGLWRCRLATARSNLNTPPAVKRFRGKKGRSKCSEDPPAIKSANGPTFAFPNHVCIEEGVRKERLSFQVSEKGAGVRHMGV